VLELAAQQLLWSGYATEHDVYIAKKLAYVLTGGELPAGTRVSEEYLLDLEREAFLSLCGHPKSQARMQHIRPPASRCGTSGRSAPMVRDAVIVTGVRTPIGKAHKGTLKDMRADDLAAIVIREAIRRTPGMSAEMIDDVILGCAMPEGEQG